MTTLRASDPHDGAYLLRSPCQRHAAAAGLKSVGGACRPEAPRCVGVPRRKMFAGAAWPASRRPGARPRVIDVLAVLRRLAGVGVGLAVRAADRLLHRRAHV